MSERHTTVIGAGGFWVGALLLLVARPGAAGVCNVPAGYPSIGEAVAVPACTEIVLAPGVLTEDVTIARTLTLRGAGTSASTLRGRVQVLGGGAVVDVEDLTIDTDGCFGIGLAVSGSAVARTLGPAAVAVVDSGGGAQCPIFRDGLETGDTARWSASSP